MTESRAYVVVRPGAGAELGPAMSARAKPAAGPSNAYLSMSRSIDSG
jgi:hypothetical protein